MREVKTVRIDYEEIKEDVHKRITDFLQEKKGGAASWLLEETDNATGRDDKTHPFASIAIGIMHLTNQNGGSYNGHNDRNQCRTILRSPGG